MAVGFSPKLPLQPDSVDGFYKLNKTLGEVVKQNLKMIILTTPGERMMHPEFGVGARNFLFETTDSTFQGLTAKINEQVRKYLPFIDIVDIGLTDENLEKTDNFNYKSTHYMRLQLVYYIPNLNLSDTLRIVVSTSP
jgi:phage baseplate assembly protein W